MAATLLKTSNLTKVFQSLKTLSVPLSGSASKTSFDAITHTGQKFDENDRRVVRFTDKEKQVNPHFAIDLINSIPPKPVKDRIVSCDGGGGALGHPKVYINLDKPGPKACGYCGLRFVLDHHH